MSVSCVRKFLSRRMLLSGLAGLILIGAPMGAAAGEPYYAPYGPPTYQTLPAQYGAPAAPPYYGAPAAPPPYYPGSRNSMVRRNQLRAQLHYAEAQYQRARESGDRGAAGHWAKEIKHLRHGLSKLDRHAERNSYGMPAEMAPPPAPVYPPPASAYAQPMPEYAPPLPAYAPPYPPTMPPSGYTGAPPAYPPVPYPPAAYPNAPATSPYGTGATGSMGSMVNSLLGPVLGSGPVP